MAHTSVLLEEVLEGLNPSPGEVHVDGTAGGGGHTLEIAKRLSPNGSIVGIDWDSLNIQGLKERFAQEKLDLEKEVLVEGNYAQAGKILKENGLEGADGFLLDLGFSSDQLGNGRGFSFQGEEEPLMMTYSDEQIPLYQVLPTLGEKEIERIIKDLSDERYSRRIAKAIVSRRKERKILTNKDLAEVIKHAVPKRYERGRINPATRTFMAFRIYINHELENLGKLLGDIDQFMNPGGRVAIISYHSKEDEMVKSAFAQLEEAGKGALIHKKAIKPTEEEIQSNPRSRSAKLRLIKIK